MLKEFVEEEWEGKSHMPKKELIQTAEDMEDDSVADDKKKKKKNQKASEIFPELWMNARERNCIC